MTVKFLPHLVKAHTAHSQDTGLPTHTEGCSCCGVGRDYRVQYYSKDTVGTSEDPTPCKLSTSNCTSKKRPLLHLHHGIRSPFARNASIRTACAGDAYRMLLLHQMHCRVPPMSWVEAQLSMQLVVNRQDSGQQVTMFWFCKLPLPILVSNANKWCQSRAVCLTDDEEQLSIRQRAWLCSSGRSEQWAHYPSFY